jgi:hypothetical protein
MIESEGDQPYLTSNPPRARGSLVLVPAAPAAEAAEPLEPERGRGTRRRARRWAPALMVICILCANIVVIWLASRPEPPTRGPLFASAAGMRFRLDVTPAKVGSNHFVLTVRTAQARAVGGLRVRFVLTMRDSMDMRLGTFPWPATTLGGGRYGLTCWLPMGGRWDVDAQVHGPGLAAGGADAAFKVVTSS